MRAIKPAGRKEKSLMPVRLIKLLTGITAHSAVPVLVYPDKL